MKKVNCQLHGEVEAILVDAILIRYKCKYCVEDAEHETSKKKHLAQSLYLDTVLKCAGCWPACT